MLRLVLSKFASSSSKDTIFALASGHVRSPVAIIRIGGPEAYKALEILNKTKTATQTQSSRQNLLKKYKIKQRYAHYRSLYSGKNELLDQAVVIFFPQKSSFNGEDIVELQIHGGRSVINGVMHQMKSFGFRMAERGEFTKRAILSGKIDCLQAEGIHELVMSDSDFSRKIALGHLMGQTSGQIEQIKDTLISCLAATQAFIDFPGQEEDIREDLLDKTKLRAKITLQLMRRCLECRNQMQMLTEGLNVTICGKPNVGKSTLLNKIVKKDIAIVSSIPGTTRDLIHSSIQYQDLQLNLTDTAGIRETEQPIEKEGINRARKSITNSHINIYVVDPSQEKIRHNNIILDNLTSEDAELLFQDKTLLIINKSDLIDGHSPKVIINGREKTPDNIMSALKEDNIVGLLDLTVKRANQVYRFEEFQSQMMLTRQRHFSALQLASNHLEQYLRDDLPVDVVAEQLRQAIVEVGSITGRIDNQKILDVLFQDFCIGK